MTDHTPAPRPDARVNDSKFCDDPTDWPLVSELRPVRRARNWLQILLDRLSVYPTKD